MVSWAHRAEFSSSSPSRSQLSLLKYPVLPETFLEFSGKEVTISFMPFPTPSTPRPHNHKQNGNYPRNSCTLYLKTAPPPIVIMLHVCTLHHMTNGVYLRGRGPDSGVQSVAMDVAEVSQVWDSCTTLVQLELDSKQPARPPSSNRCPAKGPRPQLFCQLLLLYSCLLTTPSI